VPALYLLRTFAAHGIVAAMTGSGNWLTLLNRRYLTNEINVERSHAHS
jgi:hypothetical protein